MDQLADTTFKEQVPETKVQTEIDIPSKGEHRTIFQIPGQPESTLRLQMNRRSSVNLNVPSENENPVSIYYKILDVCYLVIIYHLPLIIIINHIWYVLLNI